MQGQGRRGWKGRSKSIVGAGAGGNSTIKVQQGQGRDADTAIKLWTEGTLEQGQLQGENRKKGLDGGSKSRSRSRSRGGGTGRSGKGEGNNNCLAGEGQEKEKKQGKDRAGARGDTAQH